MPLIYFHPSNCGLRDMVIGWGPKTPKEVLLEVCKYCVHPKFVSGRKSTSFEPIAAHIFYSQAAANGAKGASAYGERIADYIRTNSLGEVLQTVALLNPDHGPNYITGFIWTPHWPNIQSWWELNKPPEKITTPTTGAAPYSAYIVNHVACACPKCNPPTPVKGPEFDETPAL